MKSTKILNKILFVINVWVSISLKICFLPWMRSLVGSGKLNVLRLISSVNATSSRSECSIKLFCILNEGTELERFNSDTNFEKT